MSEAIQKKEIKCLSIEELKADLKEMGEKHHVNFVISISMDADELPDCGKGSCRGRQVVLYVLLPAEKTIRMCRECLERRWKFGEEEKSQGTEDEKTLKHQRRGYYFCHYFCLPGIQRYRLSEQR